MLVSHYFLDRLWCCLSYIQSFWPRVVNTNELIPLSCFLWYNAFRYLSQTRKYDVCGLLAVEFAYFMDTYSVKLARILHIAGLDDRGVMQVLLIALCCAIHIFEALHAHYTLILIIFLIG